MGKVVMMKQFPDDLHKRAKLQAVKEEITLKAIIIKALEQYLKKVGG
jgi:predicted HicB family RNase H-like nuclease